MKRPPFPNEHGAWAMLAVPLILGAAVAPVMHVRVLALFVAALALFLARAPLSTLVKTGQTPERARLVGWSVAYATPAIIGGGWLIIGEGLNYLIPLAGLALVIAAIHLLLAARKQEMTVAGESLGIAGLALGAPLAYYTAAGHLDERAAALWLLNTLYFVGSVFYIKLKVRQQPRIPAPARLAERLAASKACLAYHVLAVLGVIVLVSFTRLPPLLPVALLPMAVKAFHGSLRWQTKQTLSLPRLGVGELVHATLFTLLVIAAFVLPFRIH